MHYVSNNITEHYPFTEVEDYDVTVDYLLTVTEKHYYTILGDLCILCACDYCEDMYLPRRRAHGRRYWRENDYELHDYRY